MDTGTPGIFHIFLTRSWTDLYNLHNGQQKNGVLMESYIVRIYRRNEIHADQVDGMVENTETKETISFHTLEELVSIFRKKVTTKNPGYSHEEMHKEKYPRNQ